MPLSSNDRSIPLNLQAIESCVCSIRSIERKMMSILRAVYLPLSNLEKDAFLSLSSLFDFLLGFPPESVHPEGGPIALMFVPNSLFWCSKGWRKGLLSCFGFRQPDLRTPLGRQSRFCVSHHTIPSHAPLSASLQPPPPSSIFPSSHLSSSSINYHSSSS